MVDQENADRMIFGHEVFAQIRFDENMLKDPDALTTHTDFLLIASLWRYSRDRFLHTHVIHCSVVGAVTSG